MICGPMKRPSTRGTSWQKVDRLFMNFKQESVSVAIHQPNFFPRLKVIEKLTRADIWIVLDDVAFNRRDYQHRALLYPIRKGVRTGWYTIPVSCLAGHLTRIKDVEVFDFGLAEITVDNVHRAFKDTLPVDFFDDLSEALMQTNPLTQLSLCSIKPFFEKIGQYPRIVFASSLRKTALPKSLGILQLLQLVNATEYIADSGAKNYLEDSLLTSNGIRLKWQNWPASLSTTYDFDIRNGSGLNYLARWPERLGEFMNRIHYSNSRM